MRMMHLTYAEKSLLVGDEVAALVIEYAAALARTGGADTVKIVAYGADSDKVTALLLLDSGTPLMGESTHTDMPEPDNAEAIAYVREGLARLASPPAAQPVALEHNPMSAYEHEFDNDSALPPNA
ncbi:MAG: hypothetical protein JWM50_122 [Microbacteriaceae bacterium]|jgi:hypothetical protein|nr:hypothetical protein [Microbacteriaceae bacterium]